MSISTGKNFDSTMNLLLHSLDAQLTLEIPLKYKRIDLSDDITDKLTRCDIPHVVNIKNEFTVYFSCCSEHDIVLSLSVITRFPDLIEKQIYDLLLKNKEVA